MTRKTEDSKADSSDTIELQSRQEESIDPPATSEPPLEAESLEVVEEGEEEASAETGGAVPSEGDSDAYLTEAWDAELEGTLLEITGQQPVVTHKWQWLVRWQWLVFFVSFVVVGNGLWMGQSWWKSGKKDVLLPSFPLFRTLQKQSSTGMALQAHWPGVSSQKMFRELLTPLGQCLRKASYVKTVRFHQQHDRARISLRLSKQNSTLKTYTKKRCKLPTGARLRWEPGGIRQIPFLTYRLKNRKKGTVWTQEEFTVVQERWVKPWLRSLRGVAEVQSLGGVQQQLRLHLKTSALNALNLSLNTVFARIQKILPSGKTVFRKHSVLFPLSFFTVEQLQRRVLFQDTKTGKKIRLGMVAEIHLETIHRHQSWFFNGQYAVGGRVWLHENADGPAVYRQITNGFVRQLQKWRKQTKNKKLLVSLVPVQSLVTSQRSLLSTYWPLLQTMAAMLALFLLWLLRRWRLTAIVLLLTLFNAGSVWLLLAQTGGLADETLLATILGLLLGVGLLVQVGGRATALLSSSSEEPFRTEWYVQQLSPVLSSCSRGVLLLLLCWLPLWWLPSVSTLRLRPLLVVLFLSILASWWSACLLLPLILRWVFRPPAVPSIPVRRLLPYLNMTRTVVLLVVGLLLLWQYLWWLGVMVMLLAFYLWIRHRLPDWMIAYSNGLWLGISALGLTLWGAQRWWPLGWEQSYFKNFAFVAAGCLLLVLCYGLLQTLILLWTHVLLRTKWVYIILSLSWVFVGCWVVFGSETWTGWVPQVLQRAGIPSNPVVQFQREKLFPWFPGLAREWMPSVQERWFLWEPHLPPQTTPAQARRSLQQISLALLERKEVQQVLAQQGTSWNGAGWSASHRLTFWLRLRPKVHRDASGVGHRRWSRKLQTLRNLKSALVKLAALPGVSGASLVPLREALFLREQGGLKTRLGLRVRAASLQEWNTHWPGLRKALTGFPGLRLLDTQVDFPGKVLRSQWTRNASSKNAKQPDGLDAFLLLLRKGGWVAQTSSVLQTRIHLDSLSKSALQGLQWQSGKSRKPLLSLVSTTLQNVPSVWNRVGTEWETTIWLAFDTPKERTPQTLQLRRWLWFQQWKGQALAGTPLRIQVLGVGKNQWKNERFLLAGVSLLIPLLLSLLWGWLRSFSIAVFVAGQAAIAMVGGALLLWLLQQPWFLRFSLVGVSFRELLHCETILLSPWTWIGFVGVVGLSLLEGLFWASAWLQLWQDKEPGSLKVIRKSLWMLGRVMMRWSLRTRVLLLALALPLLTWNGFGGDTLRTILWPLVGGWIFGFWTVWWMPALLGWRAERRLKKQKAAL